MKHIRRSARLNLAFVCDLGGKYFADVHAGFRNFCAATDGISLARLEVTTRLKENALNYVPVDGVICARPDGPLSVPLTGRTLPTVNISHAVRSPSVPSIVNDDFAVGAMAARFLMRPGIRSLGCLTNPTPWHSLERAIGFRRAVRAEGANCSCLVLKHPVIPRPFDQTRYFNILNEQITAFCRKLQIPAGVFCVSDHLASRLIDAAVGLGLRIPADLQVVGCDNDAGVQADAAMPMSSIELAGRRIGWMAGETLVHLLRDGNLPTVTRVGPQHVVERDTTGAHSHSAFVGKALGILRKECREPLDMRSVAERVGVSRRKLETGFRREVGHSPYEYLVIQRLDRARHLLTQTNLRIGEVAEESGFGDLRTLGTYFRRNLGMSPREWRKVHDRETVAARSGRT